MSTTAVICTTAKHTLFFTFLPSSTYYPNVPEAVRVDGDDGGGHDGGPSIAVRGEDLQQLLQLPASVGGGGGGSRV